MTALRFHRRAPDFDHRSPMTQWQRERMRGPILPMKAERKPLLKRILGR